MGDTGFRTSDLFGDKPYEDRVSEESGGARTVLSLLRGLRSHQGIGESFQANLFSGTAKHSVPVALSPGRNGFGPKPSLEYSSGSGNGVFGLGWHIGLPRVARKTEKGLPQRPPGVLRRLLLISGRALSHLWKEGMTE